MTDTMGETENRNDETSRRLAIAEMQVERSKVVMESLAGFCHALGQPATVLLSSIELLRMPETDEDTRRAVLDMCYDAVIEIRTLLARMKKRREYVAEAYLAGNEAAGSVISFDEWLGDKPDQAAGEQQGGAATSPA